MQYVKKGFKEVTFYFDTSLCLGDSFGFTVGVNKFNLKFSDKTNNAKNLHFGGFIVITALTIESLLFL